MKTEINASVFVKSYWNYYIELEEHVKETQRYVDFDSKNNSTFSIEYIKLLQAICSEIDVVGKVIASYVNAGFVNDRKANINKWGFEVQQVFTDISEIKVVFWNDFELQPWKKWKYIQGKKGPILAEKAETPTWWNDYNAVKHRRTDIEKKTRPNYTRANLKSVSTALSALFVLEKLFLEYLFEQEKNTVMVQNSRLFRMK